MSQSTSYKRGRVAVGLTALALALVSVMPLHSDAAGSPDVAQPASALGVHEPSVQQIQAEIDFVHSEGLAIRVVQHKVVPSMKVYVNGQLQLVSNAPAVEYEVGRLPGEVWPDGTLPSSDIPPTSNTSPSSSTASNDRTASAPRSDRTDGARGAARAADSYQSFNWTDSTDGNAGGYPHFYFTAHFNVSCQNSPCTENTYLVSHQAGTGTQGSTLYALAEGVYCAPTSPGFYVGSGTFNGSETYDYNNFATCSQGKSVIYTYGYFAVNGNTFVDYFNDAHTGTSSYPGDYVGY